MFLGEYMVVENHRAFSDTIYVGMAHGSQFLSNFELKV